MGTSNLPCELSESHSSVNCAGPSSQPWHKAPLTALVLCAICAAACSSGTAYCETGSCGDLFRVDDLMVHEILDMTPRLPDVAGEPVPDQAGEEGSWSSSIFDHGFEVIWGSDPDNVWAAGDAHVVYSRITVEPGPFATPSSLIA